MAITAAAALLFSSRQPAEASIRSRVVWKEEGAMKSYLKMSKQKMLLDVKRDKVAFGPYIVFFG